MRYHLAILTTVVFLVCPNICRGEDGTTAAKTWKFVSIPDFVNVDLKYPEPKWDDALDYVLRKIKAEDPDFVMVAGDELMGRWWKGKHSAGEVLSVGLGIAEQRGIGWPFTIENVRVKLKSLYPNL